jgi:hypothetical protein
MTWRQCIIGLPELTEHVHATHDLHDGRRVHVLTPGERMSIRKLSDVVPSAPDSRTCPESVFELPSASCFDDASQTVDEFTPETVKIPGMSQLCKTEPGPQKTTRPRGR